MGFQKMYIFYYINLENDKELFENSLNRSIKTNMISRTEQPNKFIMNSKYYNPHEFIVLKEKIILDERLFNNLTDLVFKNLELSKEIPTKTGLEKGEYRERKKGNIESIMHSLVFYKWHDNIEKLSVLDMVADIMYKIACSNHPFTNGNKRTALLSCGAFLDSIGLYLYYYKIRNKTSFLTQWENFMIMIADSKQHNLTEEKALELIKNYIKDYIFISFRNNIIMR